MAPTLNYIGDRASLFSTTEHLSDDRGQPVVGLPLRQLAIRTRLGSGQLGRKVGDSHGNSAGRVRREIDLELMIVQAMGSSSFFFDLERTFGLATTPGAL